ncbi:U3 small nucleolar RNA-associated protein 7 [Gracilariopsis chorda]|uniref:U3 small nucleolar RNA-associated protein 7 n=1 Tax=Gracilariopsis chorda TaxID=448386 RepID=A0A2V3IYI2_9FLOR|nr:U3 small nucleolar RNA-associated protein 7 [Gracilariopsis chorda]|eukprot:PXF47123.1 U3 small nucleolar RNA-associated protein 7 [Gracilariopsis chorda]
MGTSARRLRARQTDLDAVKPTTRKRVARANDAVEHVIRTRKANRDATVLHSDAPGLLQPQSDLEHTYHFTQAQLKPHIDLATQAKAHFHLDLSQSRLAPYHSALFSRSSRSMLIASRLGHVSLFDWRSLKLRSELTLNETVRSAAFLHDDSFFALAQKHFVYIYDAQGLQIHTLRTHREPDNLVFLPHHLLLASTSAQAAPHGRLVYTDTSTGQVLSECDYASRQLRLNNATNAAVNYSNGVVHLAHTSGVVSMWSPLSNRPLARMFTHRSSVNHVAVAQNGNWMVTTGEDARLCFWDLRTFRKLFETNLPASPSALCVSQRQLVALSFGATVQIWSPFSKSYGLSVTQQRSQPYMRQTYSGNRITSLQFCPFEDVLAVCHETGVRNMIVPGAGEPTFDTRAPNPYETRKQRRQNEVRTLIDKLPPATIMLDPSNVGTVDKDPVQRVREIREIQNRANLDKIQRRALKKKQKGRSKISKRLKKIQTSAGEARKIRLQGALEERRRTAKLAESIRDRDLNEKKAGFAPGGVGSAPLPDALQRFVRNK